MQIKGYKKFREKLPAFTGKKIAILPIYLICMAAIAFVIYITFDSFPATPVANMLSGAWLSLFPLLGVLIVEAVGFLLVWQMWLLRDRLKAKYGSTAYQQVFLFGFGGVVWVLTVAVNQYIPYYSFAPAFWMTSPLQTLATPLEAFFGAAAPVVFILREAIAVALLVIGFLMIIRAFHVFGMDYMVVLYLYFPEESQIQQNKIYSALRHPTYAGAIIVCLGGAFFTFTLLSFAVFTLYLVGFYIHIYLVEERELIQRFGESYHSYRKRVPAFFVSPRHVGTLLRFIFERDGK